MVFNKKDFHLIRLPLSYEILSRRTKISRFFANPSHEFLHFGMLRQSLDSVELALERLFHKQRVHMVMARSAQPGEPVFDVAPLEVSLVSFVRVACSWDEMVAGKEAHLTTAKFADAA